MSLIVATGHNNRNTCHNNRNKLESLEKVRIEKT